MFLQDIITYFERFELDYNFAISKQYTEIKKRKDTILPDPTLNDLFLGRVEVYCMTLIPTGLEKRAWRFAWRMRRHRLEQLESLGSLRKIEQYCNSTTREEWLSTRIENQNLCTLTLITDTVQITVSERDNSGKYFVTQVIFRV